jgi:hypothetical protein
MISVSPSDEVVVRMVVASTHCCKFNMDLVPCFGAGIIHILLILLEVMVEDNKQKGA